MKSFVAIIAVVCLSFLQVGAQSRNSFDVVTGCKQYNSIRAYDDPMDYFPTSSLVNVGRTSYSRYFRIAVVGPNDGIIRLGETLFPYDRDVIEIVLGGWANNKSVGRRQRRTAANSNRNEQLGEAQTPNLLSLFRPTIFKVEMFDNGWFEVTIDGQQNPFLKFFDIRRIPVNYMAFTKWNSDLIFFYDCPLNKANTLFNAMVLNCTTSA